jgi:hypothetical protein
MHDDDTAASPPAAEDDEDHDYGDHDEKYQQPQQSAHVASVGTVDKAPVTSQPIVALLPAAVHG